MMRILTLSKTEVDYKRLTMKSEKKFLFVLNVNVTDITLTIAMINKLMFLVVL